MTAKAAYHNIEGKWRWIISTGGMELRWADEGLQPTTDIAETSSPHLEQFILWQHFDSPVPN